MAQHAYWTGHIRLSLVTFPVRLYNAVTETQKLRLHKYDRRTGQRIHYQNLNEEGEPVEPEDIIKGYEYEKGNFVPVEEAELEKLRIESKHTIDLVQFTPLSSIDPIYFDNPYFMAPDGEIALEAYTVLREALRRTDMVALGQIVIANRERIAAIKPCRLGLIMETLRYNYEVRRAEDYFADIKGRSADKDQLKLAEQLIRAKTADFDPLQFKDMYQQGLQEIINAKLEHRKIDFGHAPKAPGNVVNIMDALRKSLAQAGPAKKSRAKPKAKPKAKKAAQKRKRA
jgi:DNA end-binding protein Ku